MFQIIWWFHLFLLSCDGDSCFDDYNCLGNSKDSTVNSQTSNIPTGQSAQGRGGAVQISSDGQLVNGKGILGEHPLNMYYSYGIRNGFGLDSILFQAGYGIQKMAQDLGMKLTL
jgi:hypothetical protein